MRLLSRRDAEDRERRRFALTEVTESKKAEETLKESEIRLCCLADQILTVRETFKLKPTKNVALPAWASKALTRLAIPASTMHPVAITLANGIKLIVQPESVSDTDWPGIPAHHQTTGQNELSFAS
jgi:hypothetical protein